MSVGVAANGQRSVKTLASGDSASSSSIKFPLDDQVKRSLWYYYCFLIYQVTTVSCFEGSLRKAGQLPDSNCAAGNLADAGAS